jgi:hypothetical protein
MLFSGSEISSVAHQLSWFGVGFLLCLITGGLFLCFTPFLWGKVSDSSGGPLLSVSCDGLLIVFQFYSVVWLRMLFTGSGDELSWPLPALFQAVAYHPPIGGPPAFSAVYLLKFAGRSAPCLPTPSPVLCASFQFLVYSVFFCWGGVSPPRELCWFIPGVAGGIPRDTWCSPVLSA